MRKWTSSPRSRWISRDGVGADLLVGVADVRVAVCVVDRGREVEFPHAIPRDGVPRPRRSPRTAAPATASAAPATVAARPLPSGLRCLTSARRCRRRAITSREASASVSSGDLVVAHVDSASVGRRHRRRGSFANGSRLLGARGRAPASGDRRGRRLPTTAQRDALAEDVVRDDFLLAAAGDEDASFLGEALSALHVELVLVAQAAHQPPARAGDLRRVEREPLVLGDAEVHGAQLGEPRGRAVLRGRSGRCRRAASPRRARRSA